MTRRTSLALFLPGAFAQVSTSIRMAFAGVEPEVELDFHPFIPSGLLAQEIRAGAQADLYVSANTRYMDELHREGFVAEPRVLAGNRLCIIARPDRAAMVRGLEDLTAPRLQLVVPQPETDPCGQYVAALFAEAGIAERMDEKQAMGTLIYSRGSGDLPGYLMDGRADAGIFYASEARSLGNAVVTIDLPPAHDFRDRIVFTVGRVARTEAHQAASTLQDWLLGPAGQRCLTDAGFLPAAQVTAPIPWNIENADRRTDSREQT